MSRLPIFASWLLASVGMVLIAGGLLAVPGNAFADAGSDCVSQMGCMGLSGSDLGMCVETCCASSTDPNCCSEACGGDTDCANTCTTYAQNQACPGNVCNTQGVPTVGLACYWNFNISRCSKKGDNIGMNVVLPAVCAQQNNCANCNCTKNIDKNGDPYCQCQ